MSSTISAGTTAGSSLAFAGDTSGSLQLQTNGTTTAVTIDTSQNVGIGTASPGAKLDVSNGTMRASQTSTASTSIVYATNSGSNNVGFWKQGSTASAYGVIAAENGAVFNTSGDLCIVNDASSKNIIFANNGAAVERMRIDSSGNVLVGTTSTSNSVVGLRFNNSVSSGFMQILSTKTLSGELNFLLNYYNGTYVGGINYTNTATSFPTSSDIRLKKDIVDAPSATQKIDNIRIVSHGWKHDDEVVDFGIIAQDLYEIMPRAVTKGDDSEEIETTWSVDYSKLVPMLIKAHQEQQALIIQLQADVAALKGKV